MTAAMVDLRGSAPTVRSAPPGGAGQRDRLVRIVHADDSPLMQLAMRAMLAAMPRFVIAAAAGTVAEAEQLVLRTHPDLLISDTDLAGQCGVGLCRWVRRASPRTIIVMLTDRDEPRLAMSALAAGAAGYLLKRTPPEELMSYLRQAAGGFRVVDASLGQSPRAWSPPDRVAEYGLSQREREVFNEMLMGQGNRAIAERLCISEDTVKSHVKAILRKLGARDRGHAIALALGGAMPPQLAVRLPESAPLPSVPRLARTAGRVPAAR
jgi:DNA-binding NarL/FixJ family response regulator